MVDGPSVVSGVSGLVTISVVTGSVVGSVVIGSVSVVATTVEMSDGEVVAIAMVVSAGVG